MILGQGNIRLKTVLSRNEIQLVIKSACFLVKNYRIGPKTFKRDLNKNDFTNTNVKHLDSVCND